MGKEKLGDQVTWDQVSGSPPEHGEVRGMGVGAGGR